MSSKDDDVQKKLAAELAAKLGVTHTGKLGTKQSSGETSSSSHEKGRDKRGDTLTAFTAKAKKRASVALNTLGEKAKGLLTKTSGEEDGVATGPSPTIARAPKLLTEEEIPNLIRNELKRKFHEYIIDLESNERMILLTGEGSDKKLDVNVLFSEDEKIKATVESWIQVEIPAAFNKLEANDRTSSGLYDAIRSIATVSAINELIASMLEVRKPKRKSSGPDGLV